MGTETNQNNSNLYYKFPRFYQERFQDEISKLNLQFNSNSQN